MIYLRTFLRTCNGKRLVEPALTHRIRGKKRPGDRDVQGRVGIPCSSTDMEAEPQALGMLFPTTSSSGKESSCFEIEINLPESKRALKKFYQDPEAFVVSMMKRKQVEVRERFLKRDEKEQFAAAKAKEVRSYIRAQCFESVPADRRPDPHVQWECAEC